MNYDYSNWFLLSDMDGTLINSHGVTPEENRAAIDFFVRNGGTFGVSTGRTQNFLAGYLEGVAVNGPSILYNGGVVYDLAARSVVAKWPIVREPALPIIEMLLRDFPRVAVEIFTAGMIYMISDPSVADPAVVKDAREFRHSCAEELMGLEWIKIVLCADHGTLSEAAAAVDAMGAKNHYETFFSGNTYFELLDVGISKGSALSAIAALPQYRGKRFASIGDHNNDAYMFRAGDLGIAVANASPECLAQADVVTVDNDSFAVAEAIRRIIPEWTERLAASRPAASLKNLKG